MAKLSRLEKEIDSIKLRNKRVEEDKAWEISFFRKIIIFFSTYIVIVVFFYFAKLPDPFKNAVVPAVAFLISTLTILLIKQFWIRNFYKK